MAREVDLDRITVDGWTVTLESYEPTPDGQELVLTGEIPTQETVEVIYTLQSDTPNETLAELFDGEHYLTDAGSAHKLLIESGSKNEVETETSVVYGNPELNRDE